MKDVKTLIEEARLMQQNRADLVAKLNELGFTQVDDKTPLSSIAKYMKWAGGLLDVRLATFNKSTFEHRYWSEEEWGAQSAQTRAQYIKMGVVLRAERQEFIIAKEDQTSPSGGTIMAWSTVYDDVKGLTNYYSNCPLKDFNGESNTDLIMAAIDYNDHDYPAARRAREYKCSNRASDGVDDPTKWSLPAEGQLWLWYKYFTQINAALINFGLTAISNSWYWSSTEQYSSCAWLVCMPAGYVGGYGKTPSSYVRAVSPAVPSPSAI